MAAVGPNESAKCPKCQGVLVTPLFCDECRSLFPPSAGTDYFQLLGLPRKYSMGEGQPHRAFRAIARRVHPDRFTAESTDDRALATRLSADVNQAHFVLSDPVRRADYLLELTGGPNAADMREVPAELLADVMTLREEIDEAKAADDDGALLRHRASITARRDATMVRIGSLAESTANLDEPKRKELRRLLNSIKYFDNLLDELAADPLAVAESATDD